MRRRVRQAFFLGLVFFIVPALFTSILGLPEAVIAIITITLSFAGMLAGYLNFVEIDV